jgi:hypothetical protein
VPLLDEHTRSSDRRPPAWRAWLAASVGLVLLWIVFSVGISQVARHKRLNPPPGGAAAQVQAAVLTDATRRLSFGDAATAAQLIASIDESRLTLADKHTYLKLASQTMVQVNSPVAESRYLDRYLSMSAQLYGGKCGHCHTPPSALSPVRFADMTTSALGKQYVAALRKAKTLTATRNQLTAAWKKKPDDVRLNVLLYHLEIDRKNRPTALRHADRLKALDKKQTGS